MRSRSAIFPKKIPDYTFVNDKGFGMWPSSLIIKVKKWDNGRQNSGPCGYKARPSYQYRRALAERARARKG